MPVLLHGDVGSTKDEGVIAEGLGQVVAVGVAGIRVLPREVAGIDIEAAAVRGVPCDIDGGKDAAVAVIEEAGAGEVGPVDARGGVGEGDVIGGVVSDELVDERGCGGVGEVRDHVNAGAGEAVLHGGEGVALEGRRVAGGGPGVIDEAVEAAQLVVDDLVDADQLLAIGGELRRSGLEVG